MTEFDDSLDSRRLDGNALAGPLRELFAVDLSGVMSSCAHCGAPGPLAEQPLYADAPPLVLRCRGCNGVLLRYAVRDDHLQLDPSGTRLLIASLP